MPQIKSLHIYPIKSMGGVSVTEARVGDRGFEHDRRWMLVDSDGHFLSQRDMFDMVNFRCSSQESGFRVQFGDETLDLPWKARSGKLLSSNVFKDVVQVLNPAKEWDEWFSDHLKRACSLVYMPEGSKRAVDEQYATGLTSLSDGFPYLLTNQRSLDELNGRLATPISMDRFRPNVVIQQLEAFQEDSITRLKSGQFKLHLAKPCSRCVMITIDQKTGEKGTEPMQTLAKYRKIDGKVRFGTNVMIEGEGHLCVGQELEIG